MQKDERDSYSWTKGVQDNIINYYMKYIFFSFINIFVATQQIKSQNILNITILVRSPFHSSEVILLF